MGLSAAPLPARTAPVQQRLLDDPTLLGDMAFTIGGPFHVMFPGQIAQNIRSFQEAFSAAGVTGRIYFGKKANKAHCAVQACAQADIGADVASTGELVAALAGGIRGDDLMVTGPEKAKPLLWLAIRHGAIIAVDSPSELARLTSLATQHASPCNPVRIVLRASDSSTQSRFGLSPAELAAAIGQLAPDGPLRLEGFSFHLSGYSATDRAAFATGLIDQCLAARAAGHRAALISLGGGFTIDYVHAGDWLRFTSNVVPQWFHQHKQFSDYYPYHNGVAGASMLSAILRHNGLAARARANGITIAAEPGRALLDQAGCTVFRVQGVKMATDYQLITVDGTSLSLSEQWFGSEYLPDPVLWPAQQSSSGPHPGCVGGASCLEQDVLSWRRIPFSRPAARGDLLIYPNTAGYQMDSNESEFHQLPLPPKLVVHSEAGQFRWRLDQPGPES